MSTGQSARGVVLHVARPQKRRRASSSAVFVATQLHSHSSDLNRAPQTLWDPRCQDVRGMSRRAVQLSGVRHPVYCAKICSKSSPADVTPSCLRLIRYRPREITRTAARRQRCEGTTISRLAEWRPTWGSDAAQAPPPTSGIDRRPSGRVLYE